MSDRQEIADVLSTVTDVTGFKYRSKTLNVGDAFPLWGGDERGPARDYETTWKIAVVLPAGEQQASEWADSHKVQIADALEAYGGCVDRIDPLTISTEAGDKDGIVLTFRREA